VATALTGAIMFSEQGFEKTFRGVLNLLTEWCSATFCGFFIRGPDAVPESISNSNATA
jgi:hypothetical protein